MLALGLACVFAALLLLVLAFDRPAPTRGVSRSLEAVRTMQTGPKPPTPRAEPDRTVGARLGSPLLRRLTVLGRRLDPTGRTHHLRRRLDLAGNPDGWDVDRVLAFKALGLLVGLLVGLALGLLLSWGVGALLAVVVLAGVLGWFVPDLVLYQMGYERTQRMRRELPDALDLLTISVESGLSFDGALAQVARNTEGPLASEFFRVLQEMQIGVGRTTAIRAMGERTDLPDLRQFSSAMVQADTFGIPIAGVLRVQAREMRIKRSQRAEEQAQKIPVKILFPLIFCIFPLLMVVILGPSIVTIARTLFGIGG
ncbi:MAG TPA: type II secretion system F family protein [Actinomycetes bacterium]|nr:type II secretion system F family protein [Actinomycetes bacterium]